MILIEVIGPTHFLNSKVHYAFNMAVNIMPVLIAQLVIQFYSVLIESYLDFENPELFKKQYGLHVLCGP